MATQVSSSLEDIQRLLQELRKFREILQQDWSRVLNQWGNLKATWQDDQFYHFEPLFEKFAADYTQREKDCENSIYFLQEQLRILDEQKQRLGNL